MPPKPVIWMRTTMGRVECTLGRAVVERVETPVRKIVTSPGVLRGADVARPERGVVNPERGGADLNTETDVAGPRADAANQRTDVADLKTGTGELVGIGDQAAEREDTDLNLENVNDAGVEVNLMSGSQSRVNLSASLVGAIADQPAETESVGQGQGIGNDTAAAHIIDLIEADRKKENEIMTNLRVRKISEIGRASCRERV